jgi:20S proteasome subunit alpha 6
MDHRFVYDAPLQTERLVTDVADRHQRATQSYVRRPYGVGMLVGGVDRTGPHLFQTCPSGNMYEWKAFALGSRSQSAKTFLERNFVTFAEREAHLCAGGHARAARLTPNPPRAVSREDLIKVAAKALHQCLEPEKELDLTNVVFGVAGVGETFQVLEGDAVAPFIAGLGAAAAPGAVAMAEEEEAAPADEGGAQPPADAPPAAAPGGMDIA